MANFTNFLYNCSPVLHPTDLVKSWTIRTMSEYALTRAIFFRSQISGEKTNENLLLLIIFTVIEDSEEGDDDNREKVSQEQTNISTKPLQNVNLKTRKCSSKWIVGTWIVVTAFRQWQYHNMYVVTYGQYNIVHGNLHLNIFGKSKNEESRRDQCNKVSTLLVIGLQKCLIWTRIIIMVQYCQLASFFVLGNLKYQPGHN